MFDVASPDRLNAVMADVQNIPILHISCHGMIDGELAFEDGNGRATFMTVEGLKNYPAISSLSVVFVSACHSRSIGAALINAGVKHVICCTNEAKLKDSAAITFAAAFYRALALGRTLKVAFDLAKSAVEHSPFIDKSHVEVGKFVLLPGRRDIDDFDKHHDVLVFFQRNSVRPLIVDENPRRISIPGLSDIFMDRKREACNIINRLLECNVVKLNGPHGIGKKSLAIFVATYLSERHYYSNVVCYCSSTPKDIDLSLEQIRTEMNDLVKDNRRALLVLDADKFSDLGVAVLSQELQNILNLPSTNGYVKMLIVSEKEGAVEFPKRYCQNNNVGTAHVRNDCDPICHCL